MLCVAPVAADDPLINPRAIAKDVYDCYKAGAAMVHLHVRDLNVTIHGRIAHLLRDYGLNTYGLRWVLPIAEGDLHWQNPLLSRSKGP